MKRLAFTKANEALVRSFLFEKWEVYYAGRRWKHMEEMRNIRLRSEQDHKYDNDDRYDELANTRYIKRPAPDDLSGACKVVSQVAMKIFSLDGEIISNKRHTFIVLSGDNSIYDLNRNCCDVQSMLINNRKPYEINRKYSASKEAVSGRKSWAGFIRELISELEGHLRTYDRLKFHSGPSIDELPDWVDYPVKQVGSVLFPLERGQKERISHG